MNFKLLELARGFFCLLAMTFPIIFPYLKGFHLVLSQHLPQRNEGGWKLSDLEWIAQVTSMLEKGKIDQDTADSLLHHSTGAPEKKPKRVLLLPRFLSCHKALVVFLH
mmetsp:Transcript_1310/g.1889  ORF Transcript_1310/g.1889 Transcript_1310/m.1889 type:complete len:108 (+) Transcript_1310:1107-1430(+)